MILSASVWILMVWGDIAATYLIYPCIFNWQDSGTSRQVLEWDVLKVYLDTQQYYLVPRAWHRATLHPYPAVQHPSPHAWFPGELIFGSAISIWVQDPVLNHQELVFQGMSWQYSCCQLQTWLEAPPGGAHSLRPGIPISNLTQLLFSLPHQLFKDW